MSDEHERTATADPTGAEGVPEGGAHACARRAAAGAGLPGLEVSGLAELPDRAILDEARLAALLKVTGRTVRRMVARFELPPPVSFGGRSVWLAGRVLSHLEAAAERAAREAERAARRISEVSAFRT